MSGHSKWSQIKRQKGAADVKRGAIFSKITNQIIMAAKNGGDPNANFTLKMAIEKARSANMPKENIERAIKRGTGEQGGSIMGEFLFEALGTHNIGILIEGITDNKNRTLAEIRGILNKYNGKLAGSGAVSYMFERMGKLLVDASGSNKEDLEFIIIDSGAQDYQDIGDGFEIISLPSELELVRKNLENKGLEIKEAGLSWEPKNIIEISNEDEQKVLSLLDDLENVEGVSGVYTNISLAKESENELKKEV